MQGLCRQLIPILDEYDEDDKFTNNYKNLRAQCYYLLASYCNENKIVIETEDTEVKQLIIEELEQIKGVDVGRKGKLKVIDKETIKEL